MAVLVAAAACDQNDSQAQQPQDRAEQEAGAQQQVIDLGHLGFNEGDVEGAAVRVVEFSDFGCIYCARFHTETYPELYREFVEGGDVAWKYIPVTLARFPNSAEAAAAGECAGAQDRFPPMRDILFDEREAWMAADDVEPLLREYAEALDLDLGAFQACLASEEPRGRLEEANQLARQIGVSGTPTFLIQGHPVEGAPPLEPFQDVLRQLVAEARDPGGR